MNKLVAVLFVCALGSLAADAQGTVNFQNIAPNLNVPVLLSDGTTKAGVGYSAALLAGPTATSLSQIATTPLLTGAQAGYFLGGVQSIPTVPGGGTAFILIEVWNSAMYPSFAAAQVSPQANAWGWSNYGIPFAVNTGNPNAIPPGFPATLTGLTTFQMAVLIPEPSFIALSALSILILFARSLKRWVCRL